MTEPETFRCNHCRRDFQYGIHIGRNIDSRQARYANYCCADCRNQGEKKFAESDRAIRNREIGRK